MSMASAGGKPAPTAAPLSSSKYGKCHLSGDSTTPSREMKKFDLILRIGASDLQPFGCRLVDEVLARDREEGASGGRDGGRVPDERGAALKPWTRDPHEDDVGPLGGGARNDGDAEPLSRELDEGVELAGFGDDPRAEAGVAAGVLEHGPQAAALRQGEHGMLVQLAEPDRRTPAEWMAALDREHERLDRNDAAP